MVVFHSLALQMQNLEVVFFKLLFKLCRCGRKIAGNGVALSYLGAKKKH